MQCNAVLIKVQYFYRNSAYKSGTLLLLFFSFNVWCYSDNIHWLTIFVLLITYLFENALILWGETKCWSISGIKGCYTVTRETRHLPVIKPQQKCNEYSCWVRKIITQICMFSLLQIIICLFYSMHCTLTRNTFSICNSTARKLLKWTGVPSSGATQLHLLCVLSQHDILLLASFGLCRPWICTLETNCCRAAVAAVAAVAAQSNYSSSVSLHPSVPMGNNELLGRHDKKLGRRGGG